jgi:hypothetical protein
MSAFKRFSELFKRAPQWIAPQWIETNYKKIYLVNVAICSTIGAYVGYNKHNGYMHAYQYPFIDHIEDTTVGAVFGGGVGIMSSSVYITLISMFGPWGVTGPIMFGGVITTGVMIGRMIENGHPWKHEEVVKK